MTILVAVTIKTVRRKYSCNRSGARMTILVAVVTCGDNEEYLVCGPEEEPTCLNQNPPIDQCMESCYCQKGYMREASGGCVRAEDCGCLYGDMFMSVSVGWFSLFVFLALVSQLTPCFTVTSLCL